MSELPPELPMCRWIRANGLEFAYLEEGASPTAHEAPLVLCLHGFPDTAYSFHPLLKTLAARGFHAVAPFMRGYAPTSIPDDADYRSAALGRDVIALIDHLGVREAFVIGHDWGAVATYAAATLRPDRIKRIVTASVPHLRRFLLRPSRRQLYRSRYIAQFQLPGWGERKLREGSPYLRNLWQEWSPGWKFTEQDLAPIQANFSDPARVKAALGYYRSLVASLMTAEAWQLISAPIPVPALVMHGSDDGCIGPEMFDDQEHLFASTYERIEMAGVGHFIHCEQADAFAENAIRFLERGA